MKIQILGAEGCKKCAKLKKRVEEVVAEKSIEGAEVEKVNDPVKVAEKGVVSTPALVVDGEVVFSGKLATKEELKDLLS